MNIIMVLGFQESKVDYNSDLTSPNYPLGYIEN
jgi:hypothetical protein